MSEITQARPYAKAVFELADADKSYEKWADELAVLASVAAHDDIQPLFTSPKFTREQRAEAFLKVCEGKVSDHAANLVRALAENDRLALLPTVQTLFDQLSNEAQNKIEVTVRTAHAIDDAQQSSLEKAIESKLKKDIQVNYEVDASLIGGVVIHAGDQVIDGSVKNRISQMATGLLSA